MEQAITATTKVRKKRNKTRIEQGDIIRNVEFIEYTIDEGAYIGFSKITFPYAIVLTQACDLEQYYNSKKLAKDNDKYLISVIVAPLYRMDDFLSGEHLSQLGLKMSTIGRRDKSPAKNIIQNENKRYHYIAMKAVGNRDVIIENVIDFKHYFTVTINYLNMKLAKDYYCSVDVLFRELISQRFSNFLSRIGLPEIKNPKKVAGDLNSSDANKQ